MGLENKRDQANIALEKQGKRASWAHDRNRKNTENLVTRRKSCQYDGGIRR